MGLFSTQIYLSKPLSSCGASYSPLAAPDLPLPRSLTETYLATRSGVERGQDTKVIPGLVSNCKEPRSLVTKPNLRPRFGKSCSAVLSLHSLRKASKARPGFLTFRTTTQCRPLRLLEIDISRPPLGSAAILSSTTSAVFSHLAH